MELFYNQRSAKQVANIAAFKRIASRYEWMNFRQPNPDTPWHVQGEIPCADGGVILVNFWPHKGRAQRDGERAIDGEEAIRNMITLAIDESQDPDRLVLFE